MKMLRSFSLYTLVGFFGAAINFFMMPVLSHFLTPEDYGLISIFNTYVLILIPLMGLVANGLLPISYFKEKDKSVFYSKFVSIQFLPAAIFVVLSVLNFFIYYRINHLLELNNVSLIWGFVLLLITLFSLYVEQYFNFLVLQKKAFQYSIFTVTKTVVEIALTLFFVVFRHMGWQGRILSWLITSLLFFLIAFFYFKKEGFLNGVIKLAYIREGILFGLPLIVHTIGKFVVNQSDRLFIAKMTSLDEAGIYNIGYTFGFLVTLFSNSFFYIFSPYILERLPAMSEYKALQIVKMSYLYVISIIGVLLVTTLVAPVFFKYFIDHRYLNGQKYVFWVGLGYVFFSFYGLFSTYIMYHNQNRFLAWLAVFNIITNLLFNYIFILLFGAIGAAYATALSFFLIFILVAIKGNKLVYLPWMKFRDIIKVPIT